MRQSRPWYRKDRGCWYVWHQGSQRKLSGDKQEAIRLWHVLLAGGRQGEALKKDAVSLRISTLVTAYLAYISVKMKPSTVNTKRKILTRIGKEVGERKVGRTVLEDWVGRHKETWSRSMLWLQVATLKALTRWASSEAGGKLMPEDPLKGWTVPGCEARGEEALVSEETHGRLMEKAPPCYREMLTFLHATGCRPGEACSLKASNVNLEAGVIVLKEHKGDKTGRPRVIVIPTSIKALVGELCERRPTGFLFYSSRSPMTPTTLGRWIYNRKKKLGITGVIAYGYRHTFATDALAGGIPESQVAALLGHASTMMLHRNYSHLMSRVQVLKDASNKTRPEPGGVMVRVKRKSLPR